jgi:hypothetical protein
MIFAGERVFGGVISQASATPYKISYARLAPSLVNDEHEVEAAVRAVSAIA